MLALRCGGLGLSLCLVLVACGGDDSTADAGLDDGGVESGVVDAQVDADGTDSALADAQADATLDADSAIDAGGDAGDDAGDAGGVVGVDAQVTVSCAMLLATVCDPMATCSEDNGIAECACRAGYHDESAPGLYGITCVDIGECEGGSDNCAASATCQNTIGSFTCTCNVGFTGDGVTCTDIDECLAGNGGCSTSPMVACTNTPGARTCGACPSGYSGDGVTCGDIDECLANNGGCDALVTCTNNTGVAVTCGACPSGYIGTGATACTPTLTGLTLSAGTLSPALSAMQTSYGAQVSIGTQNVSLTPTAPAGSTITIAGDVVASGALWQSPTLGFGANPITIVVSRSGHPSRTYTLTITRGYQEGFLKASNVGASDYFGTSIAIDGNTLVVGALNEDSNGSQGDNSSADSGAVYVFLRTGNVWAQQAYLKASTVGASDYFGSSVAIAGNTIVVGAPGEDSNATTINGSATDDSAAGSGAAYVFVRSGVTWTQQAYLKATNTNAGDAFGNSVAIAGETAIVGARLEASNATTIGGDANNNGAPAAGAAYVFVRSGVTWTQQAYLKASNTGSGDFFGSSVTVTGNTAVVSAPGEDSAAITIDGNQSDNSAAISGALYVFVRSGVVWTQQAYLKANVASAGLSSASISGETVVSGASNSERAYVFVRNGVAWSLQAALVASNPDVGDGFGYDAAISGDRIVVGAIAEASNSPGINGNQANNSAAASGAAYLFVRSGTSWTLQAYIKAAAVHESDTFGRNVAIAADSIVCGAIFEDSSAANSGAAYVIR